MSNNNRYDFYCKHCDFWIPAQNTKKEDNMGGCTYFKNTYYPMFLDELCAVREDSDFMKIIQHHKLK